MSRRNVVKATLFVAVLLAAGTSGYAQTIPPLTDIAPLDRMATDLRGRVAVALNSLDCTPPIADISGDRTFPPITAIALDLAAGLDAEAARLEKVARLRRDRQLTALATSLRAGADRLRRAADDCASARYVADALEALGALDTIASAIQADLMGVPRDPARD